MSKALELVVISILVISAFFFGVSYSGQVKENFNWLFEIKEQEVEIPTRNQEKNLIKPIKIEKNFLEESENPDNSEENSINLNNNDNNIEVTQ